MTSERWRKLESAFEVAVDLDTQARCAYLDTVCQGDADFRSEVESMLAAAKRGDSGLRAAIAASVAELPESAEDPTVGKRFSSYRITKAIARGGMGAVYEAVRDDEVFSREVAIKVLRNEFAEGPVAAQRFRQERQILAGLDHPNIARLLDGG